IRDFHVTGVQTVLFRSKNNTTQSGLEAYRQGHIPGAHYLDLEKDLSSPLASHGGRHPLPFAESFTRKMRELGLNPHMPVVVYDRSEERRVGKQTRCMDA